MNASRSDLISFLAAPVLIFAAMSVLFAVLKIAGSFDGSWLLVTMPIWASTSVIAAGFVLSLTEKVKVPVTRN